MIAIGLASLLTTYISWNDWMAVVLSFILLLIGVVFLVSLSNEWMTHEMLRRTQKLGLSIPCIQTFLGLRKLTNVVFETTSILSEGQEVVMEAQWLSTQAQKKLWSILYSMSAQSNHSTFIAIADWLKSRSTTLEVDRYEVMTHGISGKVYGESYWVGNRELATEQVDRIPASLQDHEGVTCLYFGKGQDLLARICVADPIRGNTTQVLSSLRKLGLEVDLWVDDKTQMEEKLSEEFAIDHYELSESDQGRTQRLEELHLAGKRVAMVGIGEATDLLAPGDIHFSMSRSIPNKTSVHISDDDLGALPKSIAAAKITGGVIKQNILLLSAIALMGIGILYTTYLSGSLFFGWITLFAVAAGLLICNTQRFILRRKLASC